MEIESASAELSEVQRQAVSTMSDLDDPTPFMRVLDFLEEVFLASASGEVQGVSHLLVHIQEGVAASNTHSGGAGVCNPFANWA